jgi:hypothetical protein
MREGDYQRMDARLEQLKRETGVPHEEISRALVAVIADAKARGETSLLESEILRRVRSKVAS